MIYILPVLLLTILMALLRRTEAGDPSLTPMGVVSITRGIDSAFNSDSIFRSGEEGLCNFTGTIVMGGPFSLEQEDKFYAVGSRQRVSYQLVVDYVNRFRCGISLSSGNYSIELRSYDDQSSTKWTTAIANKLVSTTDVDILLGGYSSTLTRPLSEIANQHGKLLIAPGAASTTVFAGKEKTFGTLPPTAKYLAGAIEGLAGVGAMSIATVFEDASFAKGACGAAPDMSARFGLNFTSANLVGPTPNMTVLEPVAQLLSQENPDIVVTCVYDCVPWMKAMRSINWSPKAQVFTICVGLEEFSKEVGTDAEYIFGVTPWDASLNIQDVVTGWSARDFADTFSKETADVDVTYHASSAASTMSIAIQAIEATDTTDQDLLAEYISSHSFETMHGEVSFDLNGQSEAPSLLIQYDKNGRVQTVFPTEISSSSILYPMPSWDRRDCIHLSECESLGHTCDDRGQCICDRLGSWQSVGFGATASCVQIEKLHYISETLLHITYGAIALIIVVAIIALGWVYYYRGKVLVKVSQPMFLSLIIIGTVISSSSIIPMGAQTDYRDSEDIALVDSACMASPWLWGLGFSITFSALFAKVWRVKELYGAGTIMRRRHVKHTDVIFVILVMVAIETCILLAFQLQSPLRWHREVIKDVDGYPIESVGQCYSEHGWWYVAALVGFNILCLFYALILCWQVKDIPSDFSEKNYVFLSVMFMFQVMVIAVPVSVMVKDDPNVFFFMRASAVILQNVTVLTIIFIPKMIRVYKNEDSTSSMQQKLFQSVRRSRRQSAFNNDSSSQFYSSKGIINPSNMSFTISQNFLESGICQLNDDKEDEEEDLTEERDPEELTEERDDKSNNSFDSDDTVTS